MRRLVIAAVAALAFAAPAGAAVPRVEARAFYVVSGTTGEVLAARDADERLPVASITKLMTVLVALDHLHLDDVVTVPAQAARVGESRIPLRPGQRITVRDLIAGALIQSANDAADTLAAAASEDDVPRFVEWMNERAQQLGLHDTHFARPDGLDAPGHVSSARDVSLLARVAMRSPVVRSTVRMRSAVIENGRVVLHTWNDLLGVFPGLIGVKTGHTSAAGWCEVAAAQRPGYTIYAVVLGSPTRAQRNSDLDRLLGWGVAQYRTRTLISRVPYAHVALPYGLDPLPLVASSPLVRVVRAGRPLVRRIVVPSSVSLPVVQGQRLGRIEVRAGKTLLATRPLVAARTVLLPGVAWRVRWYLLRTMHDLWGSFS